MYNRNFMLLEKTKWELTSLSLMLSCVLAASLTFEQVCYFSTLFFHCQSCICWRICSYMFSNLMIKAILYAILVFISLPRVPADVWERHWEEYLQGNVWQRGGWHGGCGYVPWALFFSRPQPNWSGFLKTFWSLKYTLKSLQGWAARLFMERLKISIWCKQAAAWPKYHF